MIKTYFALWIRNIRRDSLQSAVNIFGLSLGMACCILILLYVQSESSYDQSHHSGDRIFRLAQEVEISGRTRSVAITTYPMGEALVEEYPEVSEIVRFRKDDGRTLVEIGKDRFFETGVLFVEPNVFRVFDFPLASGDAHDALRNPSSVVIAEHRAKKYFGSTNDALGQSLVIGGESYQISGVAADTPAKSHIEFNFLIPLLEGRGWLDFRYKYYTYIVLETESSDKELNAKLPEFIERHLGDQLRAGRMELSLFLQKVTDIHLHSNLEYEISGNGDIRRLRIFAAVAIMVLLLACFNYVNLSTARAERRLREIGLRKTVGGGRSQIFGQLLGESFFQALLAMMISLLLVEGAIGEWGGLLDLRVTSPWGGSWAAWLVPLGVGLFSGILSGSYPAVILSSVRPTEAVLGSFKTRSALRRILVVFQFVISGVLMICTCAVYNQWEFMRTKSPGFQKENIVVIPLAGKDDRVIDQYKTAIRAYSQVISASASSMVPGREIASGLFRSSSDKEKTEPLMVNLINVVDHELVDTYRFSVLKGRTMRDTDQGVVFLINESALRMFGWSSIEGQQLEQVYPAGDELNVEAVGPVIGVVEDFHYQSLHHLVEPLVVANLQEWVQYLSIRITGDEFGRTLVYLSDQWRTISPETPFEYFLLDADLEKLYLKEERQSAMLGAFAAIAIMLAGMGMFGLVSQTTRQRIREIGMRKVLGAKNWQCATVLLGRLLLLLGISNVIALPIAYIAFRQWVRDFPYQTEIGSLPFLIAAGMTLLTTVVAIAHEISITARTSPIAVLRRAD